MLPHISGTLHASSAASCNCVGSGHNASNGSVVSADFASTSALASCTESETSSPISSKSLSFEAKGSRNFAGTSSAACIAADNVLLTTCKPDSTTSKTVSKKLLAVSFKSESLLPNLPTVLFAFLMLAAAFPQADWPFAATARWNDVLPAWLLWIALAWSNEIASARLHFRARRLFAPFAPRDRLPFFRNLRAFWTRFSCSCSTDSVSSSRFFSAATSESFSTSLSTRSAISSDLTSMKVCACFSFSALASCTDRICSAALVN
mmetsp:Transcript_57662/g.160733  ORF Transcript_57662/g.160733 Transcript_57662/m.160733 type:complete len:263 (+) Transcript_57662:78-866(+)